MNAAVIIYRYPSVGVGLVYVDKVRWGQDVFSHTYSAAKATRWATIEDAQRAIDRYGWPEATAILASEAHDLPPPV